MGDVGFVDCQEERKRKEEIRNMCVNKEVSLCGVSFVGPAFPLVSFGADTLKPHAVTCPRISIFPLLLFLFRLFFFYGSFNFSSPAQLLVYTQEVGLSYFRSFPYSDPFFPFQIPTHLFCIPAGHRHTDI